MPTVHVYFVYISGPDVRQWRRQKDMAVAAEVAGVVLSNLYAIHLRSSLFLLAAIVKKKKDQISFSLCPSTSLYENKRNKAKYLKNKKF